MSLSCPAVIRNGNNGRFYPSESLFKRSFAVLTYFFCGLAFVVSGWGHQQNPYALYADIRSYQLSSSGFATALAYFLPCLHIVVGAALLIRRLSPVAEWIGCTLLFSYSLAQAWAWSQGLDIDCGCFGILHAEKISGLTLLRTTGLFGVLLIATLLTHHRRRFNNA